MPIYDYECRKCGKTHEVITGADDTGDRYCPHCIEGMARRIISATGQYCGNEDATWLKCVREVVGKETAEGIAFHNNPTRSNYKAWMKKKGLRPLENNEPLRPAEKDMSHVDKELLRRHRERNRITVRG